MFLPHNNGLIAKTIKLTLSLLRYKAISMGNRPEPAIIAILLNILLSRLTYGS